MVRNAALAALTAGLLAGCTVLPGSGPTARAVESGTEVATSEGILARYVLLDMSPAVVEALRTRPPDSLLASFGDHRPALEPVIGVGDVVAVSIWEAGSGGLFSGPLIADRFSAGSKSALIPEQVVTRDGAITIPYAGRIPVAGRRTQDVQALIESELAGKAIQPQVLVIVTKPLSQAVTVTGEATGGARLPLSAKGDRLMDIIAAAGGTRAPVAETFVRLSRGTRTATVPLTTVVSNPRENIYLRPNDTLTLVRDPQTFLAVGALANATEVPFAAEGITLAQAIAKARGLSDFQSDPGGVFLFRFEPAGLVARLKPGSPLLSSPQVPVVYRLDMRDANSLFIAQGFRMRNRDLLYVSSAPYIEIQKVLSVFSSVTSPVFSAAAAYSYAR